MSTIVLFDIDGTLLSAGGAGRRAVERALERVAGREHGAVSLADIDFAGRTDPWIVEQALLHCGVASAPRLVAEVLDLYLRFLPTELERARRFEVLPGARELVEAAHGERHLALGLGTGNVQRAAYAKLGRAKLDSYFDFGGFGCDHVDRAEVLRKGFERGRARTGVASAHVVVIGDTPHDVSAARAIGARCIAVCTGWHDAGALRAAGADVVVADLRAAAVYEVLAMASAL